MGKPTEGEQTRRAIKAAGKMAEARNALNEEGAREAFQQFLEQYTICEVGLKSLLADRKRSLGKAVAENNLKIDFRQIEPALADAGISLDESILETVFDGSNKIGKRHGRGLRNSLVHSPNKKALDELQLKLTDINTAMDAFISAIETAAHAVNNSTGENSPKEEAI